ncbi:hypothetical protein MAHJHV64_37640 [Mycobacterium avium subsp. hominissuis]|jgi:hypothetical protein
MPTLDGIPRKLTLTVPVPNVLSDAAITGTCHMVEARLRHLLGQELQRRNTARLQQRLDGRAARRKARLDAAMAEAEEADEARTEARVS